MEKNTKAILESFGGPDKIKIIEEPLPLPKFGEVRIKIEAATVCNTDTIIRKGIYPLLKDKPPFTMGYDFIGRVDIVGEGVTKLKVGDRVADICQIGCNANYICRNADSLIKVPEGVVASEAVCMVLNGMTAYQIFKYFAKVKKGETFLVHGGSGAVGNTLLQLCQLNDIKVVSTASTSKHESIKALGAMPVDYKASTAFEQIKYHSPKGYDAVLDFTNQKSFSKSFGLLKKGGRMVTCAVLTTAQGIEKKTFWKFLGFGLDFGLMILKLKWWNTFTNKSAAFFGVVDSKKDFPERFQNDYLELMQLIKDGALKPLIHQKIRLNQVSFAHQLLDDGKVTGQIVVDMAL